jgi:hypothetical protein
MARNTQFDSKELDGESGVEPPKRQKHQPDGEGMEPQVNANARESEKNETTSERK